MEIICPHCENRLAVKQKSNVLEVLTMDQLKTIEREQEKKQEEQAAMAKKKSDLNASIRENESFWSSIIRKVCIPAYVLIVCIGDPFFTAFVIKHIQLNGANKVMELIMVLSGMVLMIIYILFAVAIGVFIIRKYLKNRRDKYLDGHPDDRKVWNQILAYEKQYEVDL